jgi:hypothetical protein
VAGLRHGVFGDHSPAEDHLQTKKKEDDAAGELE